MNGSSELSLTWMFMRLTTRNGSCASGAVTSRLKPELRIVGRRHKANGSVIWQVAWPYGNILIDPADQAMAWIPSGPPNDERSHMNVLDHQQDAS